MNAASVSRLTSDLDADGDAAEERTLLELVARAFDRVTALLPSGFGGKIQDEQCERDVAEQRCARCAESALLELQCPGRLRHGRVADDGGNVCFVLIVAGARRETEAEQALADSRTERHDIVIRHPEERIAVRQILAAIR